MIFPPVGLKQYTVDLVEAYDLLAVPDRLEHRRDAQVPCPAQDALGRAYDQLYGLLTERVVPQFDPVELRKNERLVRRGQA